MCARPTALALFAGVLLPGAGCIALPPPLELPTSTADASDASATDAAADGDTSPAPYARHIVAGERHACAVTGAGEVRCFGALDLGAIGIGILRQDVVGLALVGLAPAAAVATGRGHSCAVSGDAVFCWGDNRANQVEPTITPSHWDFHASPVRVPGVSGATAVALGDASTCALVGAAPERRVVCWGRRLAPAGVLPPNTEPVQVGGLDDLDPAALVLGAAHACAASADGADVRCWGRAEAGQLGDGALASGEAARPVHAALPRPIGVLAAAADYTCALVESGARVACWGDTPLGTRLVPTLLDARFEPPLVALATGRGLACGVDEAGDAHCWGDDDADRLPVAGLIAAAEPVRLTGLPPLSAIAIGGRLVCAVTRAGALWCWGDGAPSAAPGELRPDPAERASCAEPRAPCTTCADGLVAGCAFGCVGERCREAVQVHVGNSYECFRFDDGAVWCGGVGRESGTLGLGPVVPFQLRRHEAVALPGPASALAGGSEHTCALVAGVPHCWGRNQYGELGLGDVAPRDVPTALPLAGVRLLAGHTGTTCASDGASVWCWGRALHAQGGTRAPLTSPTPVAMPLAAVGEITRLAVGEGFACAVVHDGRDVLWCWGNNLYEQVTPGASVVAEPTVRASGQFNALSLGRGVGCVVDPSGAGPTLWCWGSAFDAIVAADTSTLVDISAHFPAAVAGVDLFLGFACALLVDGRVACWGRGGQGQLFALGGDAPGLGEVVVAPTLAGVRTVDVGASTACAVDARGLVRCWGAGICGEAAWRPNPNECAIPQLVGDLDPWP